MKSPILFCLVLCGLLADGVSDSAIRVKAISPRTDIALATRITQPADLSSYFSLSLYAPRAGTVKSVLKDLGDPVVAGEALVEIVPADAPETIDVLNAPFSGVVAERSIDPGTFISSPALVGESPVLLRIDRNDIVTVSAAIPEPYATEVNKDAVAILNVASLPGLGVRAPLSRVSPQLRASDRTLGIEFDLFNGTAGEHAEFLKKVEAGGNLLLRGRALPFFPTDLGTRPAAGLKPGMYATVTLEMRRPAGDAVIPSAAIVWDGGMPFVYEILEGKAVKRAVVVELDNGTHAIVRRATAGGTQDFSPTDRIVLTNQGELDDGATVQDAPGEFPPAP